VAEVRSHRRTPAAGQRERAEDGERARAARAAREMVINAAADLPSGPGGFSAASPQAVGPLPSQPRRLNSMSSKMIATSSEPRPRNRK
jgi:hypothetical protein